MMSCCGKHLTGDDGGRLGIKPTDPCILCAEKHFHSARRLMQEYGYTETNRGDAIGELALCAEHLWKLNMEPLAGTVRRIRVSIQFRKDPGALWRSAWTMISQVAEAEVAKLNSEKAQKHDH